MLAFVAGCTGLNAGQIPSATTTTAITGWERYMRLEWTAQPAGGGTDIDGYLVSLHGTPMMNVRLLGQALDANGNVVCQKIEWLQSELPGIQRSFFRNAALPPAARYRVSVWRFDTIQANCWF